MLKKWWLKIVNWYWALTYPEWTTNDVKSLFDQFANYFELQTWLMANKFIWESDGMNFARDVDTYERPSQVLARKFANCTGYLRLFSEFIRYKRCADRIEEYVLNNGKLGTWHAVMVIHDRGVVYIQSNMSIDLMTKPLAALYPQYKYIDLKDVWEK